MEKIQSDVLVIGSGGAGAMAAYECSKYGIKVVVVNKGKLGHSGCTIMAPGGMAGVDRRWSKSGDSIQRHFIDTLQAGSLINNQKLVALMVRRAAKVILDLENMGALWEKDKWGEKYLLRAGGGHSHDRAVYLEDHIGREIIRVLLNELQKKKIHLFEDTIILKIITEENGIRGAIGFDLRNFSFTIFESSTIIIATGGAGQIYSNTDNPIDVTGDGFRLALNAGASLVDMEFVQFYPLGFLYPPSLRGTLAGMPYYSHLLNSNHERFMEKYDQEKMELSTRDKVCQAIFHEVIKGNGTEYGGVFCDMTYLPKGFIAEKIPSFNKLYLSIGINPEKDLLEVAPTAHFFMGGILVNQDWETEVTGLFGAGEVCGGVHGGNRLSQNALTDALVSGKIAGRKAVEVTLRQNKKTVHSSEISEEENKINEIFERKKNMNINPSSIRWELQKLMWENVGIIRTKSKLSQSLKKIRQLKEKLKNAEIKSKIKLYNRELLLALENEALLQTAECTCLTALARTESRGAHFRSDYPTQDNKKWLKNIILKKIKNEIQIDLKDVAFNKYSYKKLKNKN